MKKIDKTGYSFSRKVLPSMVAVFLIVAFGACTQNDDSPKSEVAELALQDSIDDAESYIDAGETDEQPPAETSVSAISFDDGVLKVGTALRITDREEDYASLDLALPEIISDSSAAARINREIFEEFNHSLTLKDVAINFSGRTFPALVTDYEVVRIDDIYAIIVGESVWSNHGSGISTGYWRYYYDPAEDIELTEEVFLNRIGLSKEDVIREYRLSFGEIMKGMTREEAEAALTNNVNNVDNEMNSPVDYADIEHMFTIDENKAFTFEFSQ